MSLQQVFLSHQEADLRVTVPFFLVGQIWPWNEASAPETWSSHQCPRWTLVSLRVGVIFEGRIGGVGKRGVKQEQLADSSERRFLLLSTGEVSDPQASLCSSSRCSAFSQEEQVTAHVLVALIVVQSQLWLLSVLGSCCQCPISWLSCPLFCFSVKEGEDQKEIKIEPADAVEEVEPLPEDYYTRPINLTEGKTLVFCHFLALHFVTWAFPTSLWHSSWPKFLVVFMVGLKYWEIYDFYGNFECSLSFMLYIESSQPEGWRDYLILLLALISVCVKHQLLDGEKSWCPFSNNSRK